MQARTNTIDTHISKFMRILPLSLTKDQNSKPNAIVGNLWSFNTDDSFYFDSYDFDKITISLN